MSTAAKTSKSSSASSPFTGKKRGALGYVPGGPDGSTAKKRQRTLKRRTPWRDLPPDAVDLIVMNLAKDRACLPIMLLSMVNRPLRAEVQGNVKAWHMLYLHWRGHISSSQTPPGDTRAPPLTVNRLYRGPMGRTVVKMNPTIPRTLPNFREKIPSLGMLLRVDKPPLGEGLEPEKRQALFIYRKITALRCSPCCGVCGTTRYATKPFWNLGMRVCKDCARANMVSSLVLYEKFWIDLKSPVDGYPSFIDAVAGNVFYFNETLTPHQRLDYSSNRVDFPGGKVSMWFFWMPHLSRILNMDALAREGGEKSAASISIRACVRRCLTLRALAGVYVGSVTTPVDRSKPTVLTEFRSIKGDRRTQLFRLRKTELLDKADWYNEQRHILRLPQELYLKLQRYVDRVVYQNT